MVVMHLWKDALAISEHDETESRHEGQCSRDLLLFVSGDWLGVLTEKEFWAVTFPRPTPSTRSAP